jgi:hypothetical protein
MTVCDYYRLSIFNAMINDHDNNSYYATSDFESILLAQQEEEEFECIECHVVRKKKAFQTTKYYTNVKGIRKRYVTMSQVLICNSCRVKRCNSRPY